MQRPSLHGWSSLAIASNLSHACRVSVAMTTRLPWPSCCFGELKLIERIDATECSISKNELIKQYKDVFTGVGEFPNEPYHITLKDNAVPVIHPPRRVPLALQPKLKSTLDRLEKEGIVSKVNKPTDWVQSLDIVEKPNGNLRLCLDPRDLNKVTKKEHYRIPCTDDIISKLEGKKIFSVADLKDGFWHVPLDAISPEICTFNTPFGRYKFNKMPFGIVSAPEVFQKRNQKLFGYILMTSLLQDVMRIHMMQLCRVLEKAKLLNIKFNPDKLQYRVSEVKYVGQIISKSGIKPDPDQIKAIVEMPTPKSKTEIILWHYILNDFWHMTATAGSDVVQSGRPIFDDFFQHLWPYIGNNTANVVFQMVKRLWLIRIDQ
ncbi:retrovirus-related Pol polyprotein from transposon 17.6 [Trichonephila clavipes]|nr:retrovirus-related Pol polyprotein from transposon 17.6 [Trichonephila clavipes]